MEDGSQIKILKIICGTLILWSVWVKRGVSFHKHFTKCPLVYKFKQLDIIDLVLVYDSVIHASKQQNRNKSKSPIFPAGGPNLSCSSA